MTLGARLRHEPRELGKASSLTKVPLQQDLLICLFLVIGQEQEFDPFVAGFFFFAGWLPGHQRNSKTMQNPFGGLSDLETNPHGVETAYVRGVWTKAFMEVLMSGVTCRACPSLVHLLRYLVWLFTVMQAEHWALANRTPWYSSIQAALCLCGGKVMERLGKLVRLQFAPWKNGSDVHVRPSCSVARSFFFLFQFFFGGFPTNDPTQRNCFPFFSSAGHWTADALISTAEETPRRCWWSRRGTAASRSTSLCTWRDRGCWRVKCWGGRVGGNWSWFQRFLFGVNKQAIVCTYDMHLWKALTFGASEVAMPQVKSCAGVSSSLDLNKQADHDRGGLEVDKRPNGLLDLDCPR